MSHIVVAKNPYIKLCYLPLQNCLLFKYIYTCRASFSPVTQASGVREKRSTLCFCTAFSSTRVCVETEGLKVNLQRRGGGSGSGHTIY